MRFRWLTLFLDFPGAAFDPGVAFWRAVTGCELSPLRTGRDPYTGTRRAPSPPEG